MRIVGDILPICVKVRGQTQLLVSSVLSFLQPLLESGLGESTLRGYVVAICKCNGFIEGFTVSSQALVSHFLKVPVGCAPHISKLVPAWDLCIV